MDMNACKLALAALGATLLPLSAHAAEAESCRAVRMSDLGWTDISLTNTTAAVMLTALGYQPTQTLLGLNVTYEMLKGKQLDIFLGNWRPVQDEQFKAYFDDKSVEPLATNLEGAKFTLAVPTYVAAAGVKSYDDLAAHADKFDRKIYGIKPGSNQPLLDMITAGNHQLAGWEVVESSEAAMLMQVAKTAKTKDWVVFLGWEPHPMNAKFPLKYLPGGEDFFGGEGVVDTVTRKGYAAECPNVGKLLANLKFSLPMENEIMGKILNDGADPADATMEWLKANPDTALSWVDGVTTLDGGDGTAAVKAMLGS